MRCLPWYTYNEIRKFNVQVAGIHFCPIFLLIMWICSSSCLSSDPYKAFIDSNFIFDEFLTCLKLIHSLAQSKGSRTKPAFHSCFSWTSFLLLPWALELSLHATGSQVKDIPGRHCTIGLWPHILGNKYSNQFFFLFFPLFQILMRSAFFFFSWLLRKFKFVSLLPRLFLWNQAWYKP